MRYQGRIADWKDDKGFGFVVPNDGVGRVFVHISAFPRGGRRPINNDLVTYLLAQDDRGRPRAANIQFFGDLPSVDRTPTRRDAGRGNFGLRAVLWLMILAIAVLVGFQAFTGGLSALNPRPPPQSETFPRDPVSLFDEPAGTGSFKCDGRTSCHQLTSCAEATYFIRNCPNTKMDGDGDGIACESEWCN